MERQRQKRERERERERERGEREREISQISKREFFTSIFCSNTVQLQKPRQRIVV